MKIKFIGTGCWQGIPGEFCEDEISKNVEWNSKDFRFRTSLAIETENNKTIVVEITPDIRLQAWKYKLDKPELFIVSHWHWDHLFGLRDIHWYCEKNNPSVYLGNDSKEMYDKEMNYIPIDLNLIEKNKAIIIDNLEITPFLVKHTEETYGFLLKNIKTGKSLAYLSDAYDLPEESFDIVKNANYITLDGMYIECSESIDEDEPHLVGNKIVDFSRKFEKSKIILTNISSFCGKTHEELQNKYEDFEISYDGMEKII